MPEETGIFNRVFDSTNNALRVSVPSGTTVQASAGTQFDGNAAPYNLVAGDISKAAANAAGAKQLLADAAAYASANGGEAFVLLNAGEYYVGGSLVTTGGTNCLIPLPVVAYTAPNCTVTVRPKGLSSSSPAPFLVAPKGAVIFHSTFTGGVYDGTNGSPSIFGAKTLIHGVPGAGDPAASWMTLVFESIGFRQPANPSLAAVDATYVDRVVYRNCRWDTEDVLNGTYHYPTQPTHPTGVAALPPANNLDGFCYEGNNECVAHYGGFPVSELTNNSGVLFALECVVGLNLQAPFFHAADFGHAIVTRCNYDLAQVDPTNGVVNVATAAGQGCQIRGFIDSEDVPSGAGIWQVRVRNIHDPTSVLTGEVAYGRVVSGVGIIGAPPVVLGARRLSIRNLYAMARVPSPAVVVADAVGRANSTTIPGSPEVGGTAWNALVGTWGVNGQAFYTSTAAAATLMVTDSGKADCTVSVRPSVISGSAVVVRVQDATNALLVDLGSKGDVYTDIAGVLTKVLTGTVTINNGDYVAVVMLGTTISVYVNEVLSITGTVANFSTQTKHGMWVSSSVAARFRDFMVAA